MYTSVYIYIYIYMYVYKYIYIYIYIYVRAQLCNLFGASKQDASISTSHLFAFAHNGLSTYTPACAPLRRPYSVVVFRKGASRRKLRLRRETRID